MRKCRFCAEEIQDAAIVCKHCGRDLIPGRSGAAPPPQKVTITGADPFAEYHTAIQGKKEGKLTVVGYLGVGVGVLFMFGAVLIMLQGGAEEGVAFFVVGIGAAVASYLWVRR